MSSDWFSNTRWDAAIEAVFREKLARVRDKAQPLRIQANTLADIEPEVALRLLDEYEALGERWDMAQALVDRSTALATLGDIDAALRLLESAIEHEMRTPNVRTQAPLTYARLVASSGDAARYRKTLDILDRHAPLDTWTFPVERYTWLGARAIILAALGQPDEARASACEAQLEAKRPQSSLARHAGLGLVPPGSSAFSEHIDQVARSRS